MAISPAHKFGQIIGETLEAAIEPLLAKFASEHKLYLDKKGSRPCRKGMRCSWTDLLKNSHDLDFVLERAGSLYKQGIPVAFIEVAWRRYTKHSRNKAQEIQGAILPLAETHRDAAPFKGAVLAGVFTAGALKQLKSCGFTVLFFPYETVLEAFKTCGIDPSFGESTSDGVFALKIQAYEKLSRTERDLIGKELLNLVKG
ncbi:MAG: DNA methylase, partial [DPANN group archaeon]|nr:DNA methylase [DPANN group archaeon]